MDLSISNGSIALVHEEILKDRKPFPALSVYKLIARISSGIVESIRRKVLGQQVKIYLLLKGLHEVIVENSDDLENPKESLKQFKKSIELLNLQNDLYEKSDYFGSPEISRQIAESLQLCYSIEAELKIIAHHGKARVKTDPAIKAALSSSSHYALQKKLTALS